MDISRAFLWQFKLLRFFSASSIGLMWFIGAPVLADSNKDKPIPVPEGKAHIIRLTDQGLKPANLVIPQEDKIVFFLNETAEALPTLRINFGKKETHCASHDLKIEADGTIHSIAPIGQKDFASVCFHDVGDYPFTIFGLNRNPKGEQGSFIVQ